MGHPRRLSQVRKTTTRTHARQSRRILREPPPPRYRHLARPPRRRQPTRTRVNWQGSSRKQRLPKDWPQRRATCLRRYNNSCAWCGNKATHADHKIPGDDHSQANLQALCAECHNIKSSSEGGKSVHKGKRAKRIKPWRQPTKHPGLK